MDGFLNDQGAPRRGSSWDGQIQVGLSCPPDEGEEGQDKTKKCIRGRNRLGRGPGRCIEQRLGLIQRTGAWLPVLPLTVNGKKLWAQELRESLFLPYGINPLDLPSHCDACGAAFTIYHALEFKKGGLITARHNKIFNGVADLSGKAFTPVHMLDDPKISTGIDMRRVRLRSKQQRRARGHCRRRSGGRRGTC